MLKSRIKNSILFFFLVSSFWGYAQDFTLLPKLVPAYLEDFSDYNSFPSVCFERAIQGQDGKLWLFTCGIARGGSSLFLFQFDGYEFRVIKGNLDQLSTDALLLGIQNDRQLIGIERSQEKKRLFFYDLQNDSLAFQNINIKGLMDKGFLTDENTVIFNAVSDDEITYYQWENGQLNQLASYKDTTSNALQPISINKREAWIFDFQKKELIRVDFEAKSTKSFTTADLGIQDGFSDPEMIILPTVDARTNSKALNYFRVESGTKSRILEYNRDQDTFEDFPGVPENWTIHQTFQDQAGNIVFVFYDEKKDYQAILQDTEGKRFDYSSLLSPLNGAPVDNMESPNFKDQAMICSNKGLLLEKIKNSSAIQYFLPGKSVRAMAELPDQQILITAQNRGIYLLDLKTGNTSPFIVPGCDFQENSTHFSINKDKAGNFWMTYPNSIVKFDPLNQNCEFYPITTAGAPVSCFIGESQVAYITGQKLYLFNLITHKTTPVLLDNTPVEFPGKVHDIYYDVANDWLWVATSSGLYKVHLSQSTLEVFGKEAPFLDDRFMCIEHDEKGRLWLGTPLGGLHIYDPKNKKLTILNSKRGLGNNTVASILVDDQGDRWLGTYNGISVVSKAGELLLNLGLDDGLVEKENNRYATLKISDGRFLMGTINGLHLIDPVLIKKQLKTQKERKIYLTELTYYDKKTGENKTQNTQLANLPTLQLPASHRFLSLGFAISNYFKPKENQYAYMLDGIDKDWTFLGNQPTLNLSNLPAGKYHLLIKGSDPFGNWSAPLSISIHAKAFFYTQPWFYLVIILFLGSIAILWIRQLRVEVQKATQQIREDKAVIEAQAAQLKELDKAKARFFTNISHEFRTPLTVILGMAKRLREDPPTWVEKGTKMIIRNCNNLLDLVNQILDLRKLESGKLELNLVQGDVIPYLQYIFESFHSFAQSKEIQLHYLCDLNELYMDYDREKLLRIISNLLSNAIKFTPAGGNVYFMANGRRQTVDSPSPMDHHPSLIIKVKDTGIGIPPEKLPHIFTRFYQIDQPLDGNETFEKDNPAEGTGIGLALTKELVQLLNGNISVESRPGKGTQFTLSLPVHNDAPMISFEKLPSTHDQSVIPLPIENLNLEDDLMNTETAEQPLVLLVEDNEDVVQYLISCLQKDYQLAKASNGQQGIDKAIELIPDAIVSDVMMPEKDGYELCQTLKNDERTSHIPILLLTARSDADSRLSGLQRGADDYLTKPFDEQELLIRLKNLMEIRKKLQLHFQKHQAVSPISDNEPALTQENEFLQKIQQVMEAQLDEEDFGIMELCRAIGMSRVQLHRKIKALTGISTSHYLRKIRLHKAKELFETTDLNVTQVAYEVGFRYPSHFSTAYLEEFGVRPSETSK